MDKITGDTQIATESPTQAMSRAPGHPKKHVPSHPVRPKTMTETVTDEAEPRGTQWPGQARPEARPSPKDSLHTPRPKTMKMNRFW